jgi:hypothetical protein
MKLSQRRRHAQSVESTLHAVLSKGGNAGVRAYISALRIVLI